MNDALDGHDKAGAKRARTVVGHHSRGALGPTTSTATRRVARTCHNPICSKNPYFGWHGDKAIYCVAHKEPGMVDVKNKRCESEGCMKRGLFGYDGERARFCGGHRLEGMVDLKNKRCKWVGCAKQANFAAEGKSTACFCSEHRSPGMIDVKGRRCEVVHCTKIAGYGVEGHPPSACLLHRGPGMVDMKQHRPRLGGSNDKSRGVSTGMGGLKLDNRDATEGGAGASSSSASSKWGKRSRKNVFGVSTGVGTREGGDGSLRPSMMADSHMDMLRPARRASTPTFSQWYSDPGGYSSSAPGQSGSGQAMRASWVMGGPQQLNVGAGSGVPSMEMSAFGGQVSGSGHGGHGGDGFKLAPPPWATSRDGGGGAGGGRGRPLGRTTRPRVVMTVARRTTRALTNPA